ncbi:MAG: ribbon-helix-helix domain-containing protein [Jannaschia helgolandensis]|jgi:predicted DNA-binding ribbon-helix-helix protein|uniref:Predicted DNA-binding protein, contains Ribbon-helix-helix (RHH) domain n=1 Tax=Jannaschia helgolandensis TaxID=188906 RepID=A0A1H7NMD2_9RHOB|nr:ribbon-helix-helix domain-containing protein [Jannaschia helgolandensis]SEL24077.1 Predicted DNA-binding protein, contains Ribbon-helix-helix (RHH) domain [Jannaschia helgolandensis]
MTDARPRKRSLTLHGHRTSVSLEEAFWTAFVDMARAKGLSINALAAQIDRDRGVSAGLASAIRVAVLRDLQQMADDPRRDDGDRSGR